jgi:hypothetical protein
MGKMQRDSSFVPEFDELKQLKGPMILVLNDSQYTHYIKKTITHPVDKIDNNTTAGIGVQDSDNLPLLIIVNDD